MSEETYAEFECSVVLRNTRGRSMVLAPRSRYTMVENVVFMNLPFLEMRHSVARVIAETMTKMRVVESPLLLYAGARLHAART